MDDRVIIDSEKDTILYVPLTPEEEAERQEYQAEYAQREQEAEQLSNNEIQLRDGIKTVLQRMRELAQKVNDNTATPAEQRQALELCLRTCIRLAKLQLRELDTVE